MCLSKTVEQLPNTTYMLASFCVFFYLQKYYSTLGTQTLFKKKTIIKLQISPSSKAFENLNPRIID